MQPLVAYWPQLTAMLVLLCCAAFVSCSEAALFFLTREDRELLATRSPSGQRVTLLLAAPVRLLSSLLFAGLLVRIAYFANATIIVWGLLDADDTALAVAIGIAALLVLIYAGELLPKSLGIVFPQALAQATSLPVAGIARLFDSVLPLMRSAARAAQRIVLPNFRTEEYLDLADIERAITLGRPDATLARLEDLVLQQVVGLSDLTVVEVMQPRIEQDLFRPPVALADLKESRPEESYVLITEADTDEIDTVLPLAKLIGTQHDDLQRAVEPAIFVPWSTSVAMALQSMRTHGHKLVVVVDEYGHTLGIVTFDDLLRWVLAPQSVERGQMRRARSPQDIAGGEWHVDEATSVRRISKELDIELPEAMSTTVAGILQDSLQRMPRKGDEVTWAGLVIRVIAVVKPGKIVARLRVVDPSTATADAEGES